MSIVSSPRLNFSPETDDFREQLTQRKLAVGLHQMFGHQYPLSCCELTRDQQAAICAAAMAALFRRTAHPLVTMIGKRSEDLNGANTFKEENKSARLVMVRRSKEWSWTAFVR